MSNRRILVVDDDRLMVRTLRDILGLRGWETDSAHSGEDAVAAVRANDYAILGLCVCRVQSSRVIDTSRSDPSVRHANRAADPRAGAA